ncbi:hypothetical protein RhiirA1_390382 [Rhizophagus irregularis]|uniref:Uncharacterized protein n=1 Tax=Rhizophagus irregularis TaxID=588596 RepID=A0A2N0S7T7_9GLOM|nr:hypothetical protein RhiirA1_390382 [Rhizophagus irregularis]
MKSKSILMKSTDDTKDETNGIDYSKPHNGKPIMGIEVSPNGKYDLLMNLFIGLFNMAIEKDNNRISYLMQKAEILAEIELFYLLPHQRRWHTWFPEVIYYYANIDKTLKS